MRTAPEPVAVAGARAVSALLGLVRADERAMYARHLSRVVGPGLADRDVRRWTKRAFASYARYWVEGARLPALPASEIEARMIVERGFEHLVESLSFGRGAVLALPHVGSWEWGGAWLALRGMPMTSVAEPIEPPALARWFTGERKRLGLEIVMLGPSAGSVLLERLREGKLVGLVCDRDLTGGGVEVRFFGELTRLPAGPATLALRTGAALMTGAVYQGPGKDHIGVVNPPIEVERSGRFREDVRRVTQAMAHELEGLIRRAPEQWHLFQPNWPSDKTSVNRVEGTAKC
jgi:lauroyl/myristoyl acyltransferase